MTLSIGPLISVLERAVLTITPAAQIAVRQGGKLTLSHAFGRLDPETHAQPANRETLFDLASLTKLYTTTAFMTLVEAGKVALDQPASAVLEEFAGSRLLPTGGTVNAGLVTFRNLLIHNAGLSPWLPLDAAPGTARIDREATQALALRTPFDYPIGVHVVYSDIGLILLGMAVEKLSGRRLDVAVRERVTAPLGLRRTRFLPMTPDLMPWFAYDTIDPDPNIAPTEYCRWRGRRIQGEVHDENAWRLGGVAGHAGMFSTAEEVAVLGQMYLDEGKPLLRPETVAEMVRGQSAEGDTRRGIGFQLWSPDPEASSHPFSQRTFGHTGFTGTSLWIDPARDLIVALLTNEVYHGRENRKIAALRLDVHKALLEAVDYNTANQGRTLPPP